MIENVRDSFETLRNDLLERVSCFEGDTTYTTPITIAAITPLGSTLDWILTSGYVTFVWRHIFRTSAVRQTPFPPVSGGEDQAWMSELSWQGLKWAAISATLYGNREHQTSRSRGVSRRYVENVHFSYRWIRERAQLYGIDPRWAKRYTRHMKLMFDLSCLYRRWIRK